MAALPTLALRFFAPVFLAVVARGRFATGIVESSFCVKMNGVCRARAGLFLLAAVSFTLCRICIRWGSTDWRGFLFFRWWPFDCFFYGHRILCFRLNTPEFLF